MTRIAVLVSGRGSNLQALIEACRRDGIPAEIGLVVSDRPGAPALARANAAGVDTAVVDAATLSGRDARDAALDAEVRRAGCTLICLAGFMRVLSRDFVNAWRDRMLNIHPSLLPSFPGLDCHARAIDAGVRISGCTVHFVRPALDDGPIVAQAAVPVLPGDDEEALASRVLEAEHRLYPVALDLVVRRRVRVVDERVVIEDAAVPRGMLLNPPGA